MKFLFKSNTSLYETKIVTISNTLQHWMENGNLKELIAIDLDGSDNLTEDVLFKFINKYGPQLQGKIYLYTNKSIIFLKEGFIHSVHVVC